MKKSTIYPAPIMMAEDYWMDSQLSIARHYGRIRFNNQEYIICDKTGRDIFELSAIAAKEGRDKALEPGEPADLVIRDWIPVYRAVGRDRFMEIVKTTNDLAVAKEMAGIKTKAKKK